MRDFWCSLGVCLVGDAVVVDGSFLVLVNFKLRVVLDC